MTVSDLTPDALAKLEAKLVADLEVVRKVRALLEEHQKAEGTAAVAGVTAALPPTVVAAGPVVAASASPSPPAAETGRYQMPVTTKTYEQWILDAARLMPPEGFVLGQLKTELYKDKQNYNDGEAKHEINRLMRKGRVVVVKTATGRIGNTYRYVPTAEELVERAAAEAAKANAGAENEAPAAAAGEA